jgi:P-type conjugative transfer protein TrbJ
MTALSARRPYRHRLLAALCLTASLALTPPFARAQFAVIDVANLVQNVLTAARTLEEINNQIMQIQQFVQMLQNEARNLTSLPFSIVQQLDQSVSQITSLMRQAQGILYNIQNVQSQFQNFYPTTISPASPDAQLVADARTRWQYSLSTFQHTMEVQSQIVQNLSGDQAQMDAVVGQSQGAVGILQATQAGNQLLALQSKQLAATQALLASQARAQAIEQARQAEAEEQAHEQYQRFIGTAPGTYTPVPVTMFH